MPVPKKEEETLAAKNKRSEEFVLWSPSPAIDRSAIPATGEVGAEGTGVCGAR